MYIYSIKEKTQCTVTMLLSYFQEFYPPLYMIYKFCGETNELYIYIYIYASE